MDGIVTQLDFVFAPSGDGGVQLICAVCRETVVTVETDQDDLTLGDALLKAGEHMSARHSHEATS